ncbi:MAG: polysaccharide deacetylase family protein [Acidobacteriota bacterium]
MSRRRALVSLVSRLAVASGWTRLRHLRRRKRGHYRVFILEYHDVSPDDHERESVVSRSRFATHIRHLQKHFPIVSLGTAVDALRYQQLERDLLVITFDDGLLGNADNAWPVLRDAGATATIFLTTGFLDGEPLWFDTARRALEALARVPNPPSEHRLAGVFDEWPPRSPVSDLVRKLKYHPAPVRRRATANLATLLEQFDAPRPPARPIPWPTVRALLEQGVEFGAHTVTHPILSILDGDEQRREIIESRDRIEAMIGHRPTLFAYPNGSAHDFDQTTVDSLRSSGFNAACSTIRGANGVEHDLYRLHRLGVGSDSTAVLDARLAGLFDEALRVWLRRFRGR